MVVAGVNDECEQAAQHGLVRAVVARVDGVPVGLNNVTQYVDTLNIVKDWDTGAILL